MSELKSWQGLPADALSPEPCAATRPTYQSRPGMKFIGCLCCGKARWTIFRGEVISACPDHGIETLAREGTTAEWKVIDAT